MTMGGEKMKKIKNISFLISIVIISILIINTLTHANAGPTYWRGKQSSEILIIDENPQISVEKEDLLFDFTEEIYNDYSLSARVRAKYTMANGSENSERVQMAFPLISTMSRFNPEDIDIRVEDKPIDFQVYLGDMLYYKSHRDEEDTQFDFSSIARSITNSEYIPKNYDLNDKGKLHTYKVVSNGEKGFSVALAFENEENKSRIITSGFNGYQMIDDLESYVSRNVIEEELELFVIGEDANLQFKAYSDVDLENEIDDYTLDISIEEISLRDYIEGAVEIFNEKVPYLDRLGDNQIFNLFTKQLDESIGQNVVNLEKEAFIYIDSMDMFIVLVYDVDFPSLSSQDVSVSYNSIGTMDMMDTVEPIYTFAYILNPAKNWASFNDLNIEVRPPSSNPYIIDSSLELSRKEDGSYMGNFKTLPEEDLFFSLYYNEEITRMDKIRGYIKRNSYALIPLLASLVGIFIGFIIRLIYRKIKKVD